MPDKYIDGASPALDDAAALDGTEYVPISQAGSPIAVRTTTAQLGGGPVGGDLSGTMPDPTVVGLQTTPLDATPPTNAQLWLFNSGSGAWEPHDISGDATVDETGVLDLAATGVSAGSYGSASQVATVTLDAKGRATAAANATITKVTVTEAPSNQTATGIIGSFTYGESIVPGDILYIHTDGTVRKADANSAGKFPACALALATASSGSHDVLLFGIYRDDSLYNWATIGATGVLWLSTTAGALTQTQPSTLDDCIQPMGFATHADRIFFRPDITWLTFTT